MHPHLVTTVVAGMVAASSCMAGAIRLAKSYAKAKDPVIVAGPTGVGKSHLARLIHTLSGRPGMLVEFSAPELQDTLGYNQLFGHEKGAFTDAKTRELGLVTVANVGTLFVADMYAACRP